MEKTITRRKQKRNRQGTTRLKAKKGCSIMVSMDTVDLDGSNVPVLVASLVSKNHSIIDQEICDGNFGILDLTDGTEHYKISVEEDTVCFC